MEGTNGNGLDVIALFNTFLGLTNMEKNTMSQIHFQEIENKIDIILNKIENIERRLKDIGD